MLLRGATKDSLMSLPEFKYSPLSDRGEPARPGSPRAPTIIPAERCAIRSSEIHYAGDWRDRQEAAAVRRGNLKLRRPLPPLTLNRSSGVGSMDRTDIEDRAASMAGDIKATVDGVLPVMQGPGWRNWRARRPRPRTMSTVRSEIRSEKRRRPRPLPLKSNLSSL